MPHRLSLLLIAVLSVAGCAEGQKPNPGKRAEMTGKPSLYNRLGGEEAIARVVDDFIANVVADPQIKESHRKHFVEGDVKRLKRLLIDQTGEATGGPQKYTGKNMKDAHRGMGIDDGDFNALVDDLRRALDSNKAAPADRDELLKMLETMRPDVVEKKDAPNP
jgi:hemoglobin